MVNRLLKVFCFYLILIFPLSFYSFAQTQTENQYWNSFQFTQSIKGKFVSEVNLDQTFTSGTQQTNPFYRNSQLTFGAWIHYYATPRWKLSFFLAYFYNREVPEISQDFSPEIRTAVQGIYYIKKLRYTLTSRTCLEDRSIENNEGYFEVVYRLREMIKLMYPINGKQIRAGILYGIASDELFVKTRSSVTGDDFFDRNRLTLGLGYSITDNFQIEVAYANEYLPRTPNDKVFNAISTTVVFNNLIPNIQDKLKKKPAAIADE